MQLLLYQRLENQLQQEITAFRHTLDLLRSNDYPTKNALNLLEQLQEDLKTIEQDSVEDLKTFAEEPDTLLDLLANQHRKVASLLQFVRYLEDARTRQVPWSLIESIENLGKKLIPGRNIITCITDEHNYRVEWFQDDDYPYVVLLLPRLHRLNTLWHANIGHELFHPAVGHFLKQHNSKVLDNIVHGCREFFKKQEEHVPALWEQRRLDVVSAECLLIWERAVEEILCDLAGAAVFGPAALMSLFSMGITENLDAPPVKPSYYPSWRYRFRAVGDRVLATCRNFGRDYSETKNGRDYARSYDDFLNLFETVCNDKAVGPELDHLAKIAYKEVDRVLGSGWDFVRDRVGESKWQASAEDVASLVDRIERKIPPSEIEEFHDNEMRFRPPAFESIVIAAAIYDASWQSKKASGETDQIEYTAFLRLVLKGCEDAETRRTLIELDEA